MAQAISRELTQVTKALGLSSGTSENFLAHAGGVEFGLGVPPKCSFTTCKLRFFWQIRLASASPPTFFRGSLIPTPHKNPRITVLLLA